MLERIDATKAVFCDLVEHPGGHDGGEFPQYHEYGVNADGSVYYKTDGPESPTDTFDGEEVDVEATTKGQAVLVLKGRQLEAQRTADALAVLVAKFEAATVFTAHVPEDDEDDPDGSDGVPEEDEDDPDGSDGSDGEWSS